MDIKQTKPKQSTGGKFAKSIEEHRKRVENLSARRAGNLLPEEKNAQAVYGSEAVVASKVGYGDRVVGLEGAKEFVKNVTASAYWKKVTNRQAALSNVVVVSIKDEPIKTELSNHFTPQQLKETFALTIKAENGWVIALNPKKNTAYTKLVLIHELAHVAVAPYDHGADFQGLYMDMVYEFLVKAEKFKNTTHYAIWKHLRDEFEKNQLKTFYTNGRVCGEKEAHSPQKLNLRIDVILEETKKAPR